MQHGMSAWLMMHSGPCLVGMTAGLPRTGQQQPGGGGGCMGMKYGCLTAIQWDCGITALLYIGVTRSNGVFLMSLSPRVCT